MDLINPQHYYFCINFVHKQAMYHEIKKMNFKEFFQSNNNNFQFSSFYS